MQTFQHPESGAMLSIDTSDNPTQDEIGNRLDKALMEFNLNQEQEKSTFAEKAWEATKAVAKDVKTGFVNAPTNVASGIFKAFDGTKNVLDDATGGNYSKVMDKVQSYTPLANKGYYIDNGNIYYVDDVQKRIENVDDLELLKKAPESISGSLTEGVSQFATAFAMLRYGRIAAVGRGSTPAIERGFTLAEGSLAPNFAFDPYEFRLANFFEDYMAQNHPEFDSPEWVKWLSVDEDDGVAEARLKMLLEDTGLETVAFGLIVPLAVAYKNMKKGKPYKDSIDTALDDYYKNKSVSITNIDKQISTVNADLKYKSRIALIDRLSISAEDKKRLKAKAQKDRIAKTDEEFLGTAGKTITQDEVFKKADELYATVFHDTLDVKEAVDRVKAMGRDTVTQSEFVTFLYRTHQKSHSEVLKAAKNFEMEERVHKDALQRISTLKNIDENSRTILRQKADKEFVEATAKLQGSHDNYVKSMEAFYDGRGDTGRALNMHKQFTNFGDGTTAFKARQTFTEMMSNLDEKERATFALGFIKHIKRGAVWTMRALDELFINSILSGGKTQMVNMGMNTAMLIVDPIERLLASGIRSTILLDPNGGGKHAIDTLATAMGNVYSTRDSFKLALRAYKKGYTLLDTNTTVEGANRAVIGNDLSFDVATLKRLSYFFRDKGDKATFADYLGLIGTPLRLVSTRLLTAEDELFKNISFRGKIFGDSYGSYVRKNLEDGMSFKIAAAKAFQQSTEMVERVINYQIHKNDAQRNGTIFIHKDPEAAALAKEAIQKSREMTFTQDLDQGWEHLQKAVAAIPLARQVAPFVRTPMNLISASLQRSPIAPLSGRWWDDFTSGNPERKAQALARWSIGAGILSYVMNAPEDYPFSIASLRGASADNWNQARNERELGGAIQGSVMVDGKEYQLSRLDPIFTPFEGIATIAELHKSGKSEEAEELFSMYALALGKMLMNDTYGTGVRQLVNALNEPTGNAWKKLVDGRIGQIGRPWATMQKSINQVEDPFMREVRNYKDALALNTLGKSQNVPPRYNALFERVGRTPYAVTGLFGDSDRAKMLEELFSPIMTGEREADLIAQEVYNKNIDVTKPLPYLKGGKIDLLSDALNVYENGERVYKGADFRRYTAYDRWNDLASSMTIPNPLNPTGKEVNLRELLNQVINSKAYQDDLTDNITVQSKFGRKKVTIYQGSRKEVLTDIISLFRNTAKDRMIAENPLVQDAIKEVEINQALSQSQKTQTNLNSILEQGAGN